MAIYPTTPIPSIGSKSAYIIPIVKSEADGNYIRVRRRSTRKRESFELKYSLMSYEEYAVLEEFFDTNQGLSFTWTHPVTSAEHTVVFMMDRLEATMYETYCEVTVMLEEL